MRLRNPNVSGTILGANVPPFLYFRARDQKRGAAMPHLTTDDGVKLYYEEAGTGMPIVFVHEFAGDYRSWEPQVRYFGRRYRCIAYNARGYPPSDVPDGVELFAGPRPRRHPRRARRAEDRQGAHRRPVDGRLRRRCISASPIRTRARSLVIAGCGYGAEPAKRQQFLEETAATAKRIEDLGMAEGGASAMRSARRACSSRTRIRAAGGVRRSARRAFDRRLGAHHARRAEAPAVALRPRRPDEDHHGADPDHDRRRGLARASSPRS